MTNRLFAINVRIAMQRPFFWPGIYSRVTVRRTTRNSFANCATKSHTFINTRKIEFCNNINCFSDSCRYLTNSKLADHVKRSHNCVPEICDFCGKEFKSLSNLNVHRADVHLKLETPKLQCSVCGTW